MSLELCLKQNLELNLKKNLRYLKVVNCKAEIPAELVMLIYLLMDIESQIPFVFFPYYDRRKISTNININRKCIHITST